MAPKPDGKHHSQIIVKKGTIDDKRNYWAETDITRWKRGMVIWLLQEWSMSTS